MSCLFARRPRPLLLPTAAAILVVALCGCPVWPPTVDIPGGGTVAADVSEFQYDVTAEGTVSGTSGGGAFTVTPTAATVEPDGDRLEVNVFFDEIRAGVQLRFVYEPAGGTWRSTASDGSERFWFTWYPTADHLIAQRTTSSALTSSPGYAMEVRSDSERPWIITGIDLDFARGLTMSPANDEAGFAPIEFTRGSLRLSLTERGYILTDHPTAYTPRQLRHYDSSAVLAGVDASLESAARADPEAHLAALARELTADISDAGVKVRVIHDWVLSTVYYDLYALGGGRVAPEGPFAVLKDGAAVCEGLSRLFDYMCVAAGVHTRMITGRTPGQEAGFGHAWNAVRLNGQTLFFDPTFDSRNFRDYDGGAVITEGGVRANYFLLEATDWIHSHRPTKDLYQFLDHPVGEAEFNAGSLHSTLVSACYDSMHHLSLSFRDGAPADRIAVGTEPVVLTIDHPAGTAVEGFLRSVADLDADVARDLECQAFVQTGASTTLSLQPAAAGDYWYYLKARAPGEPDGELQYVAILYLKSSGAPTSYPFPRQYQDRYRDQQVVLESPLSGGLSPGKEYTFRFTAEGLTSATLYPYTAAGADLAGAASFAFSGGNTWELIYTVPADTSYLHYHLSTNTGSGSSPILRYYVD